LSEQQGEVDIIIVYPKSSSPPIPVAAVYTYAVAKAVVSVPAILRAVNTAPVVLQVSSG
jgi:hypothetical protein